MKTMKRYIRIYCILASQYIKERMQFRVDFFMSIIAMLALNLTAILTIWVVMGNINELAGWSYEEMLFLYGFSMVAMSPQQLLLDNVWRLSNKIVSGDFIGYCFRPINILFYYMSEVIDVKGFSQFFLGIILLTCAWVKLGLTLSFTKVVLCIFFMIGASLICMGLILFASCFSFLGGGTNGALFAASSIKGYSSYPLSIFSKALRTLFTFIMPIGFIAYYPAQFFLLDKEPMIFTYLSPFIGGIFFWVACKLWIFCAARYSGTGS